MFFLQFSEWVVYARTCKLKETPQLERYVSLFNGLSRWAQAMVLNFTTPQERGICVRKFQEVARVSVQSFLDWMELITW